MRIFGLSKAFGVGRGVRVFLNLQTGATRGEVPDPWHRRKAPQRGSKKKDQQIYRLKKQVKEQRETLFQLKNELRAASRRAEDVQDSVPPAPEEVGALPDFVVIGAMRGGTSRFYGLISRHPFVRRAAAKELHFFDRPERFEQGVGWYKSCFPPPNQKDGYDTITGEATPMYLFDPAVPGRMAGVVPGARLIALLRNPVDRALSQYHRWERTGADVPSFEETVEDELAWLEGGESDRQADRRGDRYNQLARGLYAEQLLRWREHFPEEQMLVLSSEDFFADVPGTLEKTQDFLGLPRREVQLPPEKTERPSTYEYRPMDPATRERLEAFFEPHNRRLYDLLGRDFGW